MKSVYNFVVKPKGERYNNTKKLDGGELILNTEIFIINMLIEKQKLYQHLLLVIQI